MKKIAVVMAGCGHVDGTEITEAASTLIALSEAGAAYDIYAPKIDFVVMDHISREKTSEHRDTLTEAARIARGKIQNLEKLDAKNYDGLVFPGGTGAALYLSNWFQKAAQAQVHPLVEKTIRAFYNDGKPIAAICIAPTLLAKVLGSEGVTVTLGDNVEVAKEIEKTGAQHENCAVDDFVTDREHKVITTPAYMYSSATPFQIFTGIRKAVRELVEMA